jgi:hypothetical protein
VRAGVTTLEEVISVTNEMNGRSPTIGEERLLGGTWRLQ